MSSFSTRAVRGTFSRFLCAIAACFAIGQVQAAVIAQDLGTDAPPATLGGYTLTPFGDDGIGLFTDITSLASPLGGSLTFGTAVNAREIGSGWATWSHGYTGDVYYSNGAFSLAIDLPAGTGAFYLYVEPDPFDLYSFTITADDGTSLTNEAHGDAGARGWGFWATAGEQIASLLITSSVNFAVGGFGIASATASVPEPTTLALIGAAALAFGVGRRRRA
ncbi:PEP-CTERM sorting domain-containing protein [Pseudothauera rhizosphaerae]|uniref:PEP-CTERM sorting domain-containing protein n=1 Tax=Pseudothauera rhizosphaerae TaxID=2565932 RepID=A0A4S4AH73_9RHOO|nr:PEP-CTERM sorting domain-containing protein [Pseudothauera rhizosphaerae]THF58628.1 PEP-CTERM sorting domain-containing protein [Pseudothauera rhizosphaerae]